MHFLLVDVSWECLILISVFFCEIMSFYVSISDAVFYLLSIFYHSVWLILSFCCAHFSSLIQFYSGSGRRASEFALDCFVSIKLSQIGSFHELLVLATECFFSFDIFEIHREFFLSC